MWNRIGLPGILVAVAVMAMPPSMFSTADQEAITLTKPIVQPARATYEPVRLEITLTPLPQIQVTIRSNDGVDEHFTYPCRVGECTTDTPAEVTTLITNLNTANLATRSLWRRVFDRLVADFPSRFPGGATVQ